MRINGFKAIQLAKAGLNSVGPSFTLSGFVMSCPVLLLLRGCKQPLEYGEYELFLYTNTRSTLSQ